MPVCSLHRFACFFLRTFLGRRRHAPCNGRNLSDNFSSGEEYKPRLVFFLCLLLRFAFRCIHGQFVFVSFELFVERLLLLHAAFGVARLLSSLSLPFLSFSLSLSLIPDNEEKKDARTIEKKRQKRNKQTYERRSYRNTYKSLEERRQFLN